MQYNPAEPEQAGRRNGFGTCQDPEFAEQFGYLINQHLRPDWPAGAVTVAVEESPGDVLTVMRRALGAAAGPSATPADILP